jgi:sugar transferase EpsL
LNVALYFRLATQNSSGAILLPNNTPVWKRAMDVVVAAVGLLVLSPLLVAIGVSTAIFLGRPVLFRQQRPGLGGKPFTLLKFRTMTDRKDPQGNLLDDEARLTRFGLFLRSTSLDELPELWNVLVGDMSLVGPRPLLTSYLTLYTPEQIQRHEVLPGLTGLAQVNGRNTLSWEEKFAYDVYYVNHRSLWLDLKVLMRTIDCVLRRQGISDANHSTMPPFTGQIIPATKEAA